MKNTALKIKNCIFKIFIELFIFNKIKRSKIKSRWAKKHLKKYVDFANEFSYEEKCFDDEVIIWQYWHQGHQNAPDLIKKCLESVKKQENDKKIIVLSLETIKDYINLPQKYYDLVNSGKMPVAHFSDMLRLYLLDKYGGIWIDSTIYLSDKIPQNIINSDFCVLQKNAKEDNYENNMSCFFIRAKKGSKNLKAIKCALDKYWQENDFVLNYFMFEHISTMLSSSNSSLKEEWNKMPYYRAEISGELQRIMYQNFNSEIWENLKQQTFIHKLSYKNFKETNKNTYYDKIIEGNLE